MAGNLAEPNGRRTLKIAMTVVYAIVLAGTVAAVAMYFITHPGGDDIFGSSFDGLFAALLTAELALIETEVYRFLRFAFIEAEKRLWKAAINAACLLSALGLGASLYCFVSERVLSFKTAEIMMLTFASVIIVLRTACAAVWLAAKPKRA